VRAEKTYVRTVRRRFGSDEVEDVIEGISRGIDTWSDTRSEYK
jgi:hypothetical protein